MDNPLVSFIVTTKNEEDYLEKCLKSIRNQTYKNIEVIVVDSFSDDKTVEIARKYADKAVVKDCLMPMGRNIGAKYTNGEILAFVDADIILQDNWLENALSELKDNVVAVTSDLFPDDEGLKNKILYWYLTLSKSLLFMFGIPNVGHSGTAAIVRKDIFNKADGYPNDIVACEDIAFTSRLVKYGKIKFSRKIQGYFSLRFFKKYGYVRRLTYWGKTFFKFLITGSSDVVYER
ncbi:glycosyltransferase [Candidatus Bathyarchaeota archaeon]|nr:glycosyltransferase [Candidatus Bathyarchaeota archaeon]